jgi:hypothetical protein
VLRTKDCVKRTNAASPDAGGIHSVLSPQHSPRYIERKEPEILSHLELVANTVSMEEAVQQQQGEAVLGVEG